MLRWSLAGAALLLALVTGFTTAAEGDGENADQSVPPRRDDAAGPVTEQPPAQAAAETRPSGPRNPRVLYITMKGCGACARELARLRRPGGDFESMQARGWKIGAGPENHIQVVDRDAIPDVVARLNVYAYPTVACVNDGEIVRSFKHGCTTPLDVWTFGWLLKGENERPQAAIPEAVRVKWTGSYPLRGNHWSIETDWNPSQEKVISHLRGPNHGHQITANWAIESWSYEELRSLHDDLHEREIGATGTGMGTVQASYSYNSGSYYSSAAQPDHRASQFSAGRKMFGR